jgi:8-oxo-dGTP pyrophosphatase MutT (NUDIX family)
LVVALDAQGPVALIYEPSPAFGERVLILPGGTEEPEETHEETANRELQEEVGLRAERLDYLGEIRPWSKYLHVSSFIYLARELSESRFARR